MYLIIQIGIAIVSSVVYYLLAKKYQLLKPLSPIGVHIVPTLTGLGVILVPQCLYMILFQNQESSWVLVPAVVLIIIGFIDDRINILASIRIVIQLVVAILFMLFLKDAVGFNNLLFSLIAIVCLVRTINAFNFMDGVDGMLVLYLAAVVGSLFFYNHLYVIDYPLVNQILGILGAFALIAGFYNVRKKAIFFIGDAGSIPVGALVGFVVLYFSLKVENVYFIGFISLFLIDAGYTLVKRFLQGKNIFKPHKEHLFELITTSGKASHLKVSFFYAGIQFVISGIILLLIYTKIMNTYFFLAVILLILLGYVSTRLKLERQL